VIGQRRNVPGVARLSLPGVLRGTGALVFDPAYLPSLTQGRDGSSPVTAADQPVGRIYDALGSGVYASAASDAARPLLRQSGSQWYLQHDLVDDKHTIAFGATFATAGECYRALSAKTVGPGVELLTNGDFSAGTAGWTNGSTGTGAFTVTGEVASVQGSSASNRGGLSQNIYGLATRTYHVEFDVTVASGEIWYMRNMVAGGGTQITATQHVSSLKSGSSMTPLFVFGTPNAGGNVTLDNVSVKESSETIGTPYDLPVDAAVYATVLVPTKLSEWRRKAVLRWLERRAGR
jgi:hypothetical protein